MQIMGVPGSVGVSSAAPYIEYLIYSTIDYDLIRISFWMRRV
jgi:hypothetical protein